MKQGRVLINTKICDNAPECSGIEVCPTGALFWNEDKEKIEYNAEVCCDCGLCAEACPVEAILWGKDDEEYIKNQEAIEKDIRRAEDLVVERYGAAPIEKEPIDYCDILEFINSAETDIVFIEVFSDDSINCLLHSIRVEEILSWFDYPIQYQKASVSENDNIESSGIHELPTLLIYKEKSLIGKIEGNYTDEEENKSLLKENLVKILG